MREERGLICSPGSGPGHVLDASKMASLPGTRHMAHPRGHQGTLKPHSAILCYQP